MGNTDARTNGRTSVATREPAGQGTRGQSGTIGFVFVVFFTLVVAGGIVAVGGVALSEMENQATAQQAELAMTQFDSEASMVGLGDSTVKTVEVGVSNGDSDLTVSSEGQLTIKTDSGTTIVDRTLGTVSYRSGDEVVVYQGGGVWRGTGNDSVMVSPPELHYNEGTATLPIVVVTPDDASVSPGSVRLSEGTKDLGLGPGLVSNTQVSLIITSDHYTAWGHYLETRLEDVTVEYHHHNDTIIADLGHLTIDGDYATGLVAAGDVEVDNSAGTVTSEVQTGGTVTGAGNVQCDADDDGNTDESGNECISNQPPTLSELDDAIQQMVDDSQSNDPQPGMDSGGTLTAGSYYSDGFHLSSGGETLTLDISSGNVTLFVEGNIGISGGGGIEVTGGSGTNHYAKVYTTGDFAMATGNSHVSVDSGNASRFQMYGTSEMHFAVGQGGGGSPSGFTGSVYAPRDDPATGTNDAVTEYGITSATSFCDSSHDICLGGGNAQFEGSIVGGPAYVGQSKTFTYAEELQHASPTLPANADFPPDLTYLHVSVNEVLVAGPQVGQTPTPTPAGTPTPTPTPTPAGTPTPTPTPTPSGSPTPTPSGSSPTVDSVSAADDSTCKGGPACNGQDYAEFAISWQTSDPDGDISSVTVTVKQSGSTVATHAGSADDSWTYTSNGDYGTTNYEIEVEVTDAAGNTDCRVVSDTTANGAETDQTTTDC